MTLEKSVKFTASVGDSTLDIPRLSAHRGGPFQKCMFAYCPFLPSFFLLSHIWCSNSLPFVNTHVGKVPAAGPGTLETYF